LAFDFGQAQLPSQSEKKKKRGKGKRGERGREDRVWLVPQKGRERYAPAIFPYCDHTPPTGTKKKERGKKEGEKVPGTPRNLATDRTRRLEALASTKKRRKRKKREWGKEEAKTMARGHRCSLERLHVAATQRKEEKKKGKEGKKGGREGKPACPPSLVSTNSSACAPGRLRRSRKKKERKRKGEHRKPRKAGLSNRVLPPEHGPAPTARDKKEEKKGEREACAED